MLRMHASGGIQFFFKRSHAIVLCEVCLSKGTSSFTKLRRESRTVGQLQYYRNESGGVSWSDLEATLSNLNNLGSVAAVIYNTNSWDTRGHDYLQFSRNSRCFQHGTQS